MHLQMNMQWINQHIGLVTTILAYVPLLATVVTTIGGLVRPNLTSMITHTASREEQGVVLGLTQSLNSVAMIAAPPLAGVLTK